MESSSIECAGCDKRIVERVHLSAINRHWHDECLKCACCHCRLAEVSGTFYHKLSMLLCWRDYMRLFGREGTCALCQKTISLTQWAMRVADGKLYHLEPCFSCRACGGKFCVGDEFILASSGAVYCMDIECINK